MVIEVGFGRENYSLISHNCYLEVVELIWCQIYPRTDYTSGDKKKILHIN